MSSPKPQPRPTGFTTPSATPDAARASPLPESHLPKDEKPTESNHVTHQETNLAMELDPIHSGDEDDAIVAAAVTTSNGQPNTVHTAFIGKLYHMLENQSIKHLISWTESGESFVITPSPDFSKVLAQYFKHTNISSFVRQLNMYGFNKVSDVVRSGTPDSVAWEFKHGQANFRQGDKSGLRQIKRRASRSRSSFSGSREALIAPAKRGALSSPTTPVAAHRQLESLPRQSVPPSSAPHSDMNWASQAQINYLEHTCTQLRNALERQNRWLLQLADLLADGSRSTSYSFADLAIEIRKDLRFEFREDLRSNVAPTNESFRPQTAHSAGHGSAMNHQQQPQQRVHDVPIRAEYHPAHSYRVFPHNPEHTSPSRYQQQPIGPYESAHHPDAPPQTLRPMSSSYHANHSQPEERGRSEFRPYPPSYDAQTQERQGPSQPSFRPQPFMPVHAQNSGMTDPARYGVSPAASAPPMGYQPAYPPGNPHGESLGPSGPFFTSAHAPASTLAPVPAGHNHVLHANLNDAQPRQWASVPPINTQVLPGITNDSPTKYRPSMPPVNDRRLPNSSTDTSQQEDSRRTAASVPSSMPPEDAPLPGLQPEKRQRLSQIVEEEGDSPSRKRQKI